MEKSVFLCENKGLYADFAVTVVVHAVPVRRSNVVNFNNWRV